MKRVVCIAGLGLLPLFARAAEAQQPAWLTVSSVPSAKGGLCLPPYSQRAGSDNGVSWFPIKIPKWFYLDVSAMEQEILGTIDQARYSSAPDEDLNVFIKPDPAWSFLLSSDANSIETEVKTFQKEVLSRLRGGMRVQARGEWVCDAGHGAKNELHPVHTLLAWDGGSIAPHETSVLVSTDWSFRFSRSESPVAERITARMSEAFDVLSLDTLERRPSVSSVGTLRERAVLNRDQPPSGISLMGEHRSSVTVLNWGWPLSIDPTFSVKLAPPSVVYPVFANRTGYLATWTRAEEQAYLDSIDVDFGPVGNGYQALTLTVRPRLERQEALVTFSRWRWGRDESSVTEAVSSSGLAPQPIMLRYSPSEGVEDREMTVAVTASTSTASGSSEYAPPPLSSGFGDRTLIQKRRVYRIPRSELHLSATLPIAGPQPGPSGIVSAPQCTQWRVEASVKALSGVGEAAGSFALTVERVNVASAGGEGTGALQMWPPEWVLTPVDASDLQAPIYEFAVDPTNPRAGTLIFSERGARANAAVLVRATVTTTLGEQLVEERVVRALCPERAERADWLWNLVLGAAVAERLAREGVAPTLPIDLVAGRVLEAESEPEVLREPAATQLRALRAWQRGVSVTPAQRQSLAELESLGRRARVQRGPTAEEWNAVVASFLPDMSRVGRVVRAPE